MSGGSLFKRRNCGVNEKTGSVEKRCLSFIICTDRNDSETRDFPVFI